MKATYYDHQNFWQLASIQSAAPGLSVIIVGQNLANQFGAGTAICSIIIGNLILWMVGIAIIAMVDKSQFNAVDNFKNYIGKYGGILAALILIVAFINWYAAQINFTITELNQLFHFNSGLAIRFGAGLGLFTALLSIGGIRMLRWATVVGLPLLFCYVVYSMIVSKTPVSLAGTWGLSFSAVMATILMLLPGFINFPTFFRHSRSRAHSFLAISILTFFSCFFEIATIWMKFSLPDTAGTLMPVVLLSIFMLLLLTFCNLLNIYLASACWKTFVPIFGGGKEFAIIGLLGTLIYTFVQISTPVQFLQDLTNAYIASLGIVLLLSYLIRIMVRHRPRALERAVSFSAWMFGCVLATIYESMHFLHGIEALYVAINSSVLFLLAVVFIEETLWAARKKMQVKHGSS